MTATNSKTTKTNSLKKCIHIFLVILILLAGTALIFVSEMFLHDIRHTAFEDVDTGKSSAVLDKILSNTVYADLIQGAVLILFLLLIFLLARGAARLGRSKS